MEHLVGYPINASTYVYAECRCSGCREANAKYHKENLDRKRAERIQMLDSNMSPILLNGKPRLYHPKAKHGTSSAYVYYGCQCVPCLEAHASATAKSNMKRRQARKIHAP